MSSKRCAVDDQKSDMEVSPQPSNMSTSSLEEVRAIGKYKIYETIGKGGYSWVKRGLDTSTGAAVALKFMARATDAWALEQAEQVRTEIKALTQIRHENIVKLYAYNLSAKYPSVDGSIVKTILMVLEYCPGGELFDVLYYADRLDDLCARTYAHQMINSLEACHMAGVAHRDIKPQNLLLNADFQLKLADFGLSKIIESDEEFLMKTTYVGTRGYQAPELLNNKKFTNACDIFSMGVVMFIMLAGYPPFERAHKSDRWFKPLAKGDIKGFWNGHKGCPIPEQARSLLTGMLCYRPSKRISIAEIKEHPWFTGPTLDKAELKKRILDKFKQARQKRKLDSKKMDDLQGLSLDQQATRDIGDYRNRKSVDTKDFNQMTLEQKKFAVAPRLTSETKPRGLTVFYTKYTAFCALKALEYVFSKHFATSVIEIDTRCWNKFRVKFMEERGREVLVYVLQVEVWRDCDSAKNLVHFNLIRADARLKWCALFRNILDVVLSYPIMDQGIGHSSGRNSGASFSTCKSGDGRPGNKEMYDVSNPRSFGDVPDRDHAYSWPQTAPLEFRVASNSSGGINSGSRRKSSLEDIFTTEALAVV